MGRDKPFTPGKRSQTGRGHQEAVTPNCLVDHVAFPFGPCSALIWNRSFSGLQSRNQYEFDLVPRNVYLAKNMPALLYF